MTQMTDDEAKKHLNEAKAGNWVPGWDQDKPQELWDHYAHQDYAVVVLDGSFTREQLLAMVHFHPDNQEKACEVKS